MVKLSTAYLPGFRERVGGAVDVSAASAIWSYSNTAKWRKHSHKLTRKISVTVL